MLTRLKSPTLTVVGFTCALAMALATSNGQEAPADPPRKPDYDPGKGAKSATKPGPVTVVEPKEIDAAIERGVKFLLQDQNKDGSWGSAERTKGLNIYAPVPGAHHGFRAATTALCVSSLVEVSQDARMRNVNVAPAIDRAQTWLLANLPSVKRANEDAIYNVWAHAFGISALVKLHRRANGNATLQGKLKAEVERQVGMLERYETVYGGWGYYDFDVGSKKPGGDPASFTTATGLLALLDAKGIGVSVPQNLLDRGGAAIKRMTTPDHCYIYGEYLKYAPQHPINRPGGSLGRTQVCFLAMKKLGDKEIDTQLSKEWIGRLIVRNEWLGIARKRPIPHESWFAVAGYFYYYGNYYGAQMIQELPQQDRSFYQHHLARIIMPLQEKDGSWWDYPLYNYHQQYGTAMALMTLERCRAK